MSSYYLNNAEITFNKPIPTEANRKLETLLQDCDHMYFSIDRESGNAVLYIEEESGNLTDLLNEIVDVLHPYEVVPLTHEWNRYYGDNDGYDVFDGDKFIPMCDEDFGVFCLTDEQLIAMLEHRGYTVYKKG